MPQPMSIESARARRQPSQAQREMTRVLRYAHAWMDARPTSYPPAGRPANDVLPWAEWRAKQRTSIFGWPL